MMKRVFHAMLICLFFTDDSYCQTDPARIFQVRIAPLNLFDPITGVVQVGVEKRFSSRIGASFDYGLKFNKLSISAREYGRKDYHYHKYKAEIKYFFKTKASSRWSIKENLYLSIQAFYFPQHYRNENDWLVRNRKSYHFDYSNISRKVAVASILIGNEQICGRFIFDVYCGVGIRKLAIKHQPFNLVANEMPMAKEWINLVPIDRYEGNFYRPHFANGVKLGYVLNK